MHKRLEVKDYLVKANMRVDPVPTRVNRRGAAMQGAHVYEKRDGRV